MRLDIKFKHLSKIEQKRQEALKRDQLISSDADFVPGKISTQENSLDCKLRLKGDLSDHSEKSQVFSPDKIKEWGHIVWNE